MSKTAATCTLNPLGIGSPLGVFVEDFLLVLEMLIWAICFRPIVHVAMAVGPAGWATGTTSTLGITFPTASGFNERLRFMIVVPPETHDINVGARCFISATPTQQGQVRFTVGAAAAVTLTTFTNGNNGTEQNASIATSSSGTGEIEVIVEINHNLGSATGNFLRDVRVEDQVITPTDLPDPEDS